MIDPGPSLTGTPMFGSRWVPEGKMIVIEGQIHFHRRISHRGRFKRPHGRTNGPRRYKPRDVVYQPDFDRLKQATSERR